ncbi:Uncharacterised protein [Escherichia coli]|uniref:Uncharacterized protein n=1 Tax=Escherichia coli TaxID=562 RepID=A0A377CXS4_ECOLX|nr:Uncharacterised protein [Escherichia coli]
MSGIPSPHFSPQKEVTGVASGVTRMYRCGGNRLCDNVLPEKTMPFDLLTVLPTRLDIEVNGFNGGVLKRCSFCISLVYRTVWREVALWV